MPPHSNLQEIKAAYLEKSMAEIIECHPDDTPSSLMSTISQDLIENPVITLSGFVYDDKQINQWLNTHDKGPLREPLKKEDLNPFPELSKIIEHFIERRVTLQEKKEQLLTLARTAKPSSKSDETADIFLCQISKKPIEKAYITADGLVIDKSSVTKSVNAQPFDDFDQYLKHYLWLKSKSKQRSTRAEKPKTQESNSWSSLFGSVSSVFFSSPPSTSEKDQAANEQSHSPKNQKP
jgi:U-box domain